MNKATTQSKKSQAIKLVTIDEKFYAPLQAGTVEHHETRLRSTRAVEAMNRMFLAYDTFHN